MNDNRLGACASLMTAPPDQRCHPFLLLPLNFAPGAGSVAPPFHFPPTFSGLHSPMRGRSLTIDQIFSGVAAISTVDVNFSWSAMRSSWGRKWGNDGRSGARPGEQRAEVPQRHRGHGQIRMVG